MKENEWRIDHLLFGFSIGAIASYMFLSSSFVSSESVYMLIIFNFLFVSLTFPLDGTLTRKISMLLIGNIIGLFWNYLFSLFAYTVAYYLGEFFNTLYIILSPLVNLIWIVSFWSISLTALANSKDKKLGLRFDN
ncbi:MAG: hypothetical protein OEZ18_07425 [Candidatus Bathyarchaeota archaeon]|nr:hypothetical protein [Candidatus Bathyarchaeota archaeon]